MQFAEHLSVGFFYGLGVGALMYIFTYLIGTAINIMSGEAVVPVQGLSLASLAFGVFTALGMSVKNHAKGE